MEIGEGIKQSILHIIHINEKDDPIAKKREIIICNGYSGCRLVFWKDEIAKSDNISECDMLYVKKAYVAGEYGGLSNVYINFDTEVSKKSFSLGN